MPRKSGIWYRSGRGWYTKQEGRQVFLHTEKSAALTRFHELTRPEAKPAGLSVAELVGRYLSETASRVKPSTLEGYRISLDSFSEVAGTIEIREIRQLHVSAWLDSHPTWGPSFRHLAGSHAKIFLRWCWYSGYLERSPIEYLRLPGILRRENLPEEQVGRFRDSILSAHLRDWFDFAVLSGCRPGEQAGITARLVSQDRSHVLVTGKTGQRPVWLNDQSRTILERLEKPLPTDAIFRNSRGGKWTRTGLGQAFRLVADRSGVSLQPYHCRHIFASRLRAAGVGLDVIAKLLGHKSLSMSFQTYVGYGSLLAEAVTRAAGKCA